MRSRLIALVVALASATIALTGTSEAALKVRWMPGVKSAGTAARYDKVGVIKVGSPSAHNVLVIEPGTSAGGAYFVPLAIGAYPVNAFFGHLIPFLRQTA